MPFTPYHFGPGILFKAGLSRFFSFGMFLGTQALIDCETLFFILKNEAPIHRFFHTYLGANVVALLAVFPGKMIYEGLARIAGWNVKVSTRAALVTGFVGGYSHVFFDSIMHPDVRPLAPWSDANPLYRVVSLGALHWGCLAAGLAGAVWFIASRKKV